MVFAILRLMAINTVYRSNLLFDVNLVVHAMLNLRSGYTASGINYNITLSRFPGTRKMKQVFKFLTHLTPFASGTLGQIRLSPNYLKQSHENLYTKRSIHEPGKPR